MRVALIMLSIALPLIEIGVLIKVGSWLGFWPTLGIVVLTGVLGVAVLMEHGLTAAMRLQRAMLEGEAPLLTVVDSALVVLASILLITPGLVADVLGLVLLVPPLRRLAARGLGRWFLVSDVAGTAGPTEFPGTARPSTDSHSDASGTRPGNGHRRHRPDNGGAGPVIEGEFTRLGERSVEPERGSDRPRRSDADRS